MNFEFNFVNSVTIFAFLFSLVFFLSPKGQLFSLRNIFIFLWSYYCLCVPLDKIFGVKLLKSANLHFIDLNLATSNEVISYVTILYIMLLAGFLGGYRLAQAKLKDVLDKPSRFKNLIPSYKTVLLINFIVFGLNFLVFGGETRSGKSLLIREDFLYKIIFAPTVLMGALNAFYIYLSDDRKGVLWVFSISCAGILLSGGRTTLIYYTLLLIFKYRIELKTWVKLVSIPAFACFVFLWKGLYNNFINYISGYKPVPILNPDYNIGLSRFEGIMSYSITTTVISDGRFESPLLFGWSYLQSLGLLFFRGAFTTPIQTLAESYGTILAPEVMKGGGGIAFSGILEAWLNFGFFGPLVVGVGLGFVARYFDVRRNHVLIPIVLMCFLRFFRSDWASMFKRFVVLNGGMLIAVALIVYLYRIWYKRRYCS